MFFIINFRLFHLKIHLKLAQYAPPPPLKITLIDANLYCHIDRVLGILWLYSLIGKHCVGKDDKLRYIKVILWEIVTTQPNINLT